MSDRAIRVLWQGQIWRAVVAHITESKVYCQVQKKDSHGWTKYYEGWACPEDYPRFVGRANPWFWQDSQETAALKCVRGAQHREGAQMAGALEAERLAESLLERIRA